MWPVPDPTYLTFGFLVGALVGLTGIGGGSLLTPLLILVAGVRPAVAVGTDLAFAAITKAVGAGLHARGGTADLRLALRLAAGGVPGALLGAFLIGQLDRTGAADPLLTRLLGIVLLVAAAAGLFRALGLNWSAGLGDQPGTAAAAGLGFGVGVLVGITSIGAGSLLMALFALLYRLPASRAVGTDVVYGAVLAAAAAAAHGIGGRVELPMLASLLVGSIPGVLLGSWMCGWLPARPVRFGIAAMLAIAGLRLL
jgi:uncharacterized membrane protein YfcA